VSILQNNDYIRPIEKFEDTKGKHVIRSRNSKKDKQLYIVYNTQQANNQAAQQITDYRLPKNQ
jgi:hypothetical protein